eukprot:c11073_g1_i1.p1 GENE.c11073_g1_i1~~c11073_g1_i1.p1  ORF type:complete len:327 (-),score=67.63 c11073_g1_i1:25-1005(-)
MAATALQDVKAGGFVRQASAIRNWIKADGSTQYRPQLNRYSLIVSLACPWASRCLAVRVLKGLESVIDVTVVNPIFQKTSPDPLDQHSGWTFHHSPEFPEVGVDPSGNNLKTVREFYEKFFPGLTRFTVPILFDKETSSIVNNESSEIIRMLNSEFNEFAKFPEVDLCPPQLVEKIDEVNKWVYEFVNNGVYKSGFAQQQEPYNTAVHALFDALDKLEVILSQQRYLVSNTHFTEADIRLFVTLVRFDDVYVGHFKCNKKRIADYPNLSNYVRDVYQIPGIASTVNTKHIVHHYHRSHPSINPFGIVPIGPGVDFTEPHDRDRFSK